MIDETNITSVDETTQNVSSPNPQKSGKVKYCEKCRKSYDAINKVCPYCGHKNKYTALKVGIGVMVGGTILFGAIPDLAKDKEDDSSSVPDRAIATEANTMAEATTEIVIETTKSSATAIITTEKTTESAESFGEKNAKKKAKDYVDLMAFSYNGLVKQLEFENFTHEEAVYGADNCGADWKEEAVEKAKDYLDMYGMSRQGLKDQLLFDEFTDEEAEYALTVVYAT